MIAIAIIGILVTIVTMSTIHAKERARMAVFYADIHQVKVAAGRFEADVGFYPLDVSRNVDPGLAEKYGWKDGGHSSQWDTADAAGQLNGWNGPYIEKWMINPWGGFYDWDNYPPDYSYMGIKGGAVYLTLKPNGYGGTAGIPPPETESVLERQKVDASPISNSVMVSIGKYFNNTEAASP